MVAPISLSIMMDEEDPHSSYLYDPQNIIRAGDRQTAPHRYRGGPILHPFPLLYSSSPNPPPSHHQKTLLDILSSISLRLFPWWRWSIWFWSEVAPILRGSSTPVLNCNPTDNEHLLARSARTHVAIESITSSSSASLGMDGSESKRKSNDAHWVLTVIAPCTELGRWPGGS